MNQKILGDKPKHNFDDNLADVVNAKFDEEERLEKLKKGKDGANTVSYNSSPNEIILPGENRTASEWKKYAEQNNLGLVSMVDFYQIAKKYSQKDCGKTNEYGVPLPPFYDEDLGKQAEVLRKDLKENGLITSTVINYAGLKDFRRNVNAFTDFNPNYIFFSGVIIHSNYAGLAPTEYFDDRIPILEEGATLKEIKGKYNFAQDFLRALFGTKDSVEIIAQNLCNFTQLPETRIKLYTMTRRHIVGARDVVIKYENNNLLMLCDRKGLKGKAWRAE